MPDIACIKPNLHRAEHWRLAWMVAHSRNTSGMAVTALTFPAVACFVLVGIFINQIFDVLRFDSLAGFFGSLGQIDAFVLFAYGVTVWRICQCTRVEIASKTKFSLAMVLLGALPLFSLSGDTIFLGLPLTGLALLTLHGSANDRHQRVAGHLMLAIAGFLFWGPALFRTFAAMILQAEATITAFVLALLRTEHCAHCGVLGVFLSVRGFAGEPCGYRDHT
jgi:hypothetical protein